MVSRTREKILDEKETCGDNIIGGVILACGEANRSSSFLISLVSSKEGKKGRKKSSKSEFRFGLESCLRSQ